MTYKTFIFDLDGTMLDTSVGVLGALRDMERLLGLTPVSDEKARGFIGPPTADGLRAMHPEVPAQRQPELLRVYCDCYFNGRMFEATVYPRLPETLAAIRDSSAFAAVSTAKMDYAAKEVLEHFGLYDRFDMVAAVTDTMNDKAVLVRRVLEKAGCAPREALVIGDSHFDGDAAARAGTDFLAALYGFGFVTVQDAQEFSPVAAAQTPQQLYELVCGYLK